MNGNQKLLIAIGVVIAIALILCFCNKNGKEKFTWANAVESNPGTFNTSPNDYELISDCSTQHNFADLVAPAVDNQNVAQAKEGFEYGGNAVKKANLPLPTRPQEMPSAQDLLPDDGTSPTMFDNYVCDPEVYLFRATAQAALKSPQFISSDPYRGDLPIVPCRTGWFDTRYNESDSRLDGYFSIYNQAKMQALQGYTSKPMYVENGEIIMDSTPQGDCVMNSY